MEGVHAPAWRHVARGQEFSEGSRERTVSVVDRAGAMAVEAASLVQQCEAQPDTA